MSEFHTGCGAYCDSDDPCMCCQLGTEVDSLHAGARVAQAAAGKRIAELTALLKAADDVVASQDRRIAAALDLMDDRANSSPGYPLLERVLRGES